MKANCLLQTANFPVTVLESNTITPGNGDTFRVTYEEDGYHGRFELLNKGQVQTLDLNEISRFEISGGKVELDLRKWHAPVITTGISLLTPFPVLLEAGVVTIAAVTSGFVTPKIRFICEKHDGQYFIGMLSVLGFGAAHTLWQKKNRQQVYPELIHR